MHKPPLTVLESFIHSCFSHGQSTAGVILGRRETGKTDHGLYIAEVLWRTGVMATFATNIKIYETPPGLLIDHIIDLESLEVWASANTGKKLFILDEAGKSLRRRTPMARLNIQLLDKLQTLRKYRLSLIMITPAEKYIDNASLGSDVIDFVVIKPQFKNPKIADYYDAMHETSKGFTNIPATSIKFDTWDIAPFTLKPLITARAFPSKAVEIAYKNAKEHISAKDLGIFDQQLARYRKEAIIYLVETYLTPNPRQR